MGKCHFFEIFRNTPKRRRFPLLFGACLNQEFVQKNAKTGEIRSCLIKNLEFFGP